jgi:hypothetical protein
MATRRGYYRAELERANNHVEIILMHLARVLEAYGPQHPEIALMAEEIGDALVKVHEAIYKIHEMI